MLNFKTGSSYPVVRDGGAVAQLAAFVVKEEPVVEEVGAGRGRRHVAGDAQVLAGVVPLDQGGVQLRADHRRADVVQTLHQTQPALARHHGQDVPWFV